MKKSLGPRIAAYPTPVWVIGSYDSQGKPNAMTAAWGGVCCSEPPCIQVSVRPSRHTYTSVLARKAFTVSIPDAAHAAEADYFGIASGQNTDKFARTGLTPVRSETVDAPYVGEFPLVIECRLLHSMELGAHAIFVGEIMGTLAEEETLTDGKLDMAKLSPLLYSVDQRSYFGVGQVVGKAYSLGLKYHKQD